MTEAFCSLLAAAILYGPLTGALTMAVYALVKGNV
jgi:hypothetical protein